MKPLVLLFLLGCCGGCGETKSDKYDTRLILDAWGQKQVQVYGIPFHCKWMDCDAEDIADLIVKVHDKAYSEGFDVGHGDCIGIRKPRPQP
jgi:hypothetical protein